MSFQAATTKVYALHVPTTKIMTDARGALALAVVQVHDLTDGAFLSKFYNPGLPVYVCGAVTTSPWCHLTSQFRLDAIAAATDLASLSADVSVNVPFDTHSNAIDLGDTTLGEAVSQLRDRQRPDGGAVDANDDGARYVKAALPVGYFERVVKDAGLTDLPHFLTSASLTSVTHPMLLAPDTYFSWFYAGEKGSVSRSHVDVMCSDAWLVVFEGAKEWVMVHPLDKHMVQDPATGAFADLFSIDHVAFPQARRARMCRFTQQAGDAVFVPADCVHAVRNTTASVSITYNFILTSATKRWSVFVQKMVPDERIATVDLFVFCSASGKRISLRTYIENLVSLPSDDILARSQFDVIHQAYRVCRRVISDAACVGVPIGYDRCCEEDFRLVLYYDVPEERDFEEMFARSGLFAIEDVHDSSLGDAMSDVLASRSSAAASSEIMNMNFEEKTSRAAVGASATHGAATTTRLVPRTFFPALTSHFGLIPQFPPLPAFIGHPRYTDATLNVAPLMSLAEKSLTGAVPGSLWHYSRFPFTPFSSDMWCGTAMFYCSPDFDGPMHLHPLTEDRSLQPLPPLSAPNSDQVCRRTMEPTPGPGTYAPHFEQLKWNLASYGAMSNPPMVVDIPDGRMLEELTEKVFGRPQFVEELLDAARRHRLQVPQDALSFSDIGVEKVMALVLWFSAKTSLVGFTYSQTFSSIPEPNTLCLIGSAASSLLSRVAGSDTAQALTIFCDAAVGRQPIDALCRVDWDAAHVNVRLRELWIAMKYREFTQGADADPTKVPTLRTVASAIGVVVTW